MNTTLRNEGSKPENAHSPTCHTGQTLCRLAVGMAMFLAFSGAAVAAEESLVAALAAVPKAGVGGSTHELDAIAVEASYIAITRNYLASIARYPTGREPSLHRPQGQVVIQFEIERNGLVRQASVAKSSESMILDSAAIATVRRGKYPALPANFHSGDSSRAFMVTFNYGPRE